MRPGLSEKKGVGEGGGEKEEAGETEAGTRPHGASSHSKEVSPSCIANHHAHHRFAASHYI